MTPVIKEEGTTELSFQVPVLSVPGPTQNQPSADETLSLQMLRQAKISGVETVTPQNDELSIAVPSDWVSDHVASASEHSVMVEVPELGTSVDPPATNVSYKYAGYETAV